MRQHSRGVDDLRKQADMTKGTRVCSIDECTKKAVARGQCNTHYSQWRNSQDHGPCPVPECDRRAVTRGFCQAHYRRWLATGSFGETEIRSFDPSRGCAVKGCLEPHDSRGYCREHHRRWLKNGDPGPAVIRKNFPSQTRDEFGRKRCSRCKNWLSEDKFGPNGTAKDGLSSDCLRCRDDRHLRKSFNITIDQYEQMLEAQGGVCAICRGKNRNGWSLAVDHDHSCCSGTTSCGKPSCIRGILCTLCNQGIGFMRDNPGLMETAADYLRQHAG